MVVFGIINRGTLNLLLIIITQTVTYHGIASARLNLNKESGRVSGKAEAEYRPGIEAVLPLAIGRFDLEASVQVAFAGSAALKEGTNPYLTKEGINFRFQHRIEPYRLFLSYNNTGYELRLGLQQINFGSAIILRPLRWFDRIDPLDPLKNTSGVYGLLGRYYLASNRLWIWCLIGNTAPKGMETTPTPGWTPEPGARIEIGLPRGEAGLSFHHRQTAIGADTLPENKFGVDGRWDIGIGIWSEAVAVKAADRWQEQVMLGGDYTFALGNGLTVLAEHMVNHTDAWLHYSAVSLSYPVNITDNLTQLFLFDWQEHSPYIYLAGQRTLDRWRFILAGFIYNRLKNGGVGLRVIFNH